MPAAPPWARKADPAEPSAMWHGGGGRNILPLREPIIHDDSPTDAQQKRSMKTTLPWSLTRCLCGCDRRATHLGLTDGFCMMSGCELTVRRWVRYGARAPIKKDETKR